jgi:metal-dependent hydrolase (beta-lactamase superfamily II)
LWGELVPQLQWEVAVCRGQGRDECVFERLDRTFRRIHAVVVGFHQLELAFILSKKLFDMFSRLIVHNVEFGFKSFRF